VNRVALFTKFGVFEMLGFPVDDSTNEGVGRVVNLDEPPGVQSIGPALSTEFQLEFDTTPANSNEAFYRLIFNHVKSEIERGATEQDIRSWALAAAKSTLVFADLIREAVEDALGNRPLRYGEAAD
jgi:hypothetical protein